MSIVGIFGQWRQWGSWLVWLLPAHAALTADLNLPREGWATWQVATVADAPDWCCFDRDGDRPSRNCELDGRNHGYGSRSEDAPVASMQIYARFKGGSPDRIRAYGPNCPVSAKTAIADLGEVDADRSAQWLAAQITPRSDRSGDALAALAAHAGTTAQTELVRVAKANPARENRKDAIFWLGQLRGEPGVAAIEPLLASDPDVAIREHAAFSISQSQSSRRGELLIHQAQTDASPRVRSQAWFWLAQIGDARAEDAIRAALKSETSREVRHQAIFALSQLPDERGIQALIALLEDRGLKLDERKQALFWLGQSDSEVAQRYLAKVLGA